MPAVNYQIVARRWLIAIAWTAQCCPAAPVKSLRRPVGRRPNKVPTSSTCCLIHSRTTCPTEPLAVPPTLSSYGSVLTAGVLHLTPRELSLPARESGDTWQPSGPRPLARRCETRLAPRLR